MKRIRGNGQADSAHIRCPARRARRVPGFLFALESSNPLLGWFLLRWTWSTTMRARENLRARKRYLRGRLRIPIIRWLAANLRHAPLIVRPWVLHLRSREGCSHAERLTAGDCRWRQSRLLHHERRSLRLRGLLPVLRRRLGWCVPSIARDCAAGRGRVVRVLVVIRRRIDADVPFLEQQASPMWC